MTSRKPRKRAAPRGNPQPLASAQTLEIISRLMAASDVPSPDDLRAREEAMTYFLENSQREDVAAAFAPSLGDANVHRRWVAIYFILWARDKFPGDRDHYSVVYAEAERVATQDIESGDPQVQFFALRSLSTVPMIPGIRTALQRIMQRDQPAMAYMAAALLVEFPADGTADHIHILARGLRCGDPAVQIIAVQALAKLDIHTDAVIGALMAMMDTREPGLIALLLESLQLLGSRGRAAQKKLEEWAGDSGLPSLLRDRALFILGRVTHGLPHAPSGLMRFLSDDDIDLFHGALCGIAEGEHFVDEVVDILAGRLESPEAVIRAWAAEAISLSRKGALRAMGPLCERARIETDRGCASCLAQAIAAAGPVVATTAISMLASDNMLEAHVGRLAASLLGEDGVVALAVELARDGNQERRLRLATAIPHLRPTTARGLHAMFEAVADDPYLTAALVRAVADSTMAADEAVPALIRLLGHEDVQVIEGVERAIRQFGGEAVVELERVASDARSAWHKRACKLLAVLRPLEASRFGSLLDLATSDLQVFVLVAKRLQGKAESYKQLADALRQDLVDRGLPHSARTLANVVERIESVAARGPLTLRGNKRKGRLSDTGNEVLAMARSLLTQRGVSP